MVLNYKDRMGLCEGIWLVRMGRKEAGGGAVQGWDYNSWLARVGVRCGGRVHFIHCFNGYNLTIRIMRLCRFQRFENVYQSARFAFARLE